MTTGPNTPDFTAEIIGIAGTVLGTILGWLLQLISNNKGKIHIYETGFQQQKSGSEEYAYIIKLFIYNASCRQQCVRNVRFAFAQSRHKVLFESIPGEGNCCFDKVRTISKDKVGMISVNSFAQKEYVLSDLIVGENYKKLLEVKKIYLLYEDRKNHTKRKIIKKDFKLADVEKCESCSFY